MLEELCQAGARISVYQDGKMISMEEISGNKKRKTNQEWLDLQKEVQEFLKTATEEDRKLIGGYTESLCMICSAIREGLR